MKGEGIVLGKILVVILIFGSCLAYFITPSDYIDSHEKTIQIQIPIF
jgi:hypothetical protein